jgi:hypothetical protein
MRLIPRLFATALLVLTTAPAAAQIYWQAPDFSGPPLTMLEPGLVTPLPGATPTEEQAALIWNMRSGLNLAALQCGFEPLLRTEQNYNAMLTNHRDELAAAYGAIANYFKRTNKTAAASQKALDTYGTRAISSFSTVRGQLGFCHAAGRVGYTAMSAPRGSLLTVAMERLRELYNAQKYQPEQQFRTYVRPNEMRLPRFENECWDKKGRYKQACGISQ